MLIPVGVHRQNTILQQIDCKDAFGFADRLKCNHAGDADKGKKDTVWCWQWFKTSFHQSPDSVFLSLSNKMALPVEGLLPIAFQLSCFCALLFSGVHNVVENLWFFCCCNVILFSFCCVWGSLFAQKMISHHLGGTFPQFVPMSSFV